MHKLVLLLLLLVLARAAGTAQAAPASAEVMHFPGYDGPLPSKHYAGYISVGKEVHKRHLYYYFATSERNPSEDPVTFWIHGGRTCSGFNALVQHNGPFRIKDYNVQSEEQINVRVNPYSWTKVSNVIYVDSPAGVGFSYADTTEDYETNDIRTTGDLYEFILKWFAEFPEFLPNQLYLGGVSYSGALVPIVAQEIVNGNEVGQKPNLNFKGYSLGNPLIDFDVEKNAKIPFAHLMGLISDEIYQDLINSCGEDFWGNSLPDCLKNMETFQENIKGINLEHILYLPCHFQMGLSMQEQKYSLGSDNNSTDDVYCYDFHTVPKRLYNLETSRKSLHAMPVEVSGEWESCTKRVHHTRNFFNLIPYHLKLTTKGYRAFIYSGDHDMNVPRIATAGMLKSLNYTEIKKWHPWFVEDQIAGYNIQYDHHLLFATFKGAGHAVTQYMPREALIAYSRWIDGAESLSLDISAS